MAVGKTNSYILTWIEQLQSKGKIAFSYDEVIADFPEKSENAIIQSLSRLSQRGRVVSIYKSFYLIIPPEYSFFYLLMSSSVLFKDSSCLYCISILFFTFYVLQFRTYNVLRSTAKYRNIDLRYRFPQNACCSICRFPAM